MNTGPIGVFDSGVGGLSMWRELARALPCEDFLYVADQAHMPYGTRPPAEIGRFTLAIARFLATRGCKAIVVACNTASAAALKSLREVFPAHITVGMEPAVKPAAALTRRGVVGILATPGTFEGRLFQETARRHAGGVRLVTQRCAGLAELIETGHVDDDVLRAALQTHLAPVRAAAADVLVLACTHYAFVRDEIQAFIGPDCEIVDPAPAVARHVAERLRAERLATPRSAPGRTTFYTTGDVAVFATALRRLVGVGDPPHAARWCAEDTIVDTDDAPVRERAIGIA